LATEPPYAQVGDVINSDRDSIASNNLIIDAQDLKPVPLIPNRADLDTITFTDQVLSSYPGRQIVVATLDRLNGAAALQGQDDQNRQEPT
jgi:hypothetical protein